MLKLTPPEIWKWHAVLLGIHARRFRTNISLCFSVNMRTMPKVLKELNKSYGDNEGIAAWKPYSYHSDQKRTPEFVYEIQAMTENDPSKSIRFTARDMGVSEFLIWQAMHEETWYFSYKIRMGQCLSQTIKEKKKDCAAKHLHRLKHPL